ncbi:MAG: ferritin-like domain-containing protein [Chthoniobacterales bacterium]
MDINTITKHLTTPGGTSRRQALKTLGAGAMGLAGLRMLTGTARAASGAGLDAAVLQFALNLEYLEAQFYTYAVFGTNIESQGIKTTGAGTKGGVTIKSNPKVPFSDPLIKQYAQEIGQDERHHVSLFRGALTAAGVEPVAQPQIDLLNSFNTLASAAGIGPSFDPFLNDTNFLLGAFIFEDVGVTAFNGAAPLLTNKDFLASAAGVLAVEAYHAGNIRVNLLQLKQQATTGKISALRALLSGAADDQNIVDAAGNANINPTDDMGRAFARTTRQVLNIVYGAADATQGLFYPNGLNGAITK